MGDESRTDRDRERSVSGSIVAEAVAFATTQGLPIERIEAVTGRSAKELAAPEARHRFDVVGLIWRELMALHPDRPLPLELAKAAPISALYTLWQGACFAPDLRAALTVVVEFRHIMSDHVLLELRERPPLLRLSHPADVVDNGIVASAAMAITSLIIRNLLRLSDVFASVDLMSRAYGPPAAYEEFFGVPVRFEAERTALLFTPDALDRPVPIADPNLFEFARQRLEELHRRTTTPDPLAEVRAAVAANAAVGEFGLDALARRLGMSGRALQRLVADHGTTPSELIDEVRSEHARALLDDRKLSLDEIAERIGYSSGRSFRRAFQRATGQTPTQYRRLVS